MGLPAALLLAIVLVIAVIVVCVIAWHWDAKRTARRSSGPGLPRNLAEHQRRRAAECEAGQTVVLQTLHPVSREVIAEVRHQLRRREGQR
jgi:hypothetical protein